MVVKLVDWDDNAQYDRTGLQTNEVEILGVRLPQVIVPLVAGKNITVISEVVAMNHLLKYSGVNSAGLGVSSLMTEPSERSGERIGRDPPRPSLRSSAIRASS